MSKSSPMQLSLDYLNKKGYTCEIVEHWNHFGMVRKDCFGFGDILAYRKAFLDIGVYPAKLIANIVLVQTTSWSNFTARMHKVRTSPHCRGWKAAGGRILLHAWGPKGLREEEL